jgi:excinuclease ABC subunit A
VIKTADWVVDLGPKAAAAAARSSPKARQEQIAKTRGSHTGKFLKKLLVS